MCNGLVDYSRTSLLLKVSFQHLYQKKKEEKQNKGKWRGYLGHTEHRLHGGKQQLDCSGLSTRGLKTLPGMMGGGAEAELTVGGGERWRQVESNARADSRDLGVTTLITSLL